MAIDATWDADTGIWTLEAREAFDLDALAQLIDGTDWHGSKRFLWDLRELERGPGSSSELQQAVTLLDRTIELWSGSRVAILVRRDLDFGVARMFSALANEIDVEYRVFREEAPARSWLDAPTPP